MQKLNKMRDNRCLLEEHRPKPRCGPLDWASLVAVTLILIDLSFDTANCNYYRPDILRQKATISSQKFTTTNKSKESANFLQNANYSPNNRGHFHVDSKFGERLEAPLERLKEKYLSHGDRMRRRADTSSKITVWSQPDPRKSYSLPINLGSLSLRSLKRNRPTGEAMSLPKKIDTSTFRRSGPGGSSSGGGTKRAEPSVEQQLIPDMAKSNASNLAVVASPSHSSPILAASDEDDQAASAWRTTEQSIAEPGGQEVVSLVPKPVYQQQAARGMITLIRYMPVLMSVPAEHLVAGPARPSYRPIQGTRGDFYDFTTTPSSYYGQMYGAAASKSEATTNRLVKYQLDSLAASNFGPTHTGGPSTLAPYDFDPETYAYYPGGGSNGQAALMQGAPSLPLPSSGAYQQQPATQPVSYLHQAMGPTTVSGGATSKALSAYASKLIAMLRPSSLLSSIGQTHILGPTALNQLQPAAQIYLLSPASPATSTTTTEMRPPSNVLASSTTGRPVAVTSPLKPDDLLLNQASSKLQSMASTRTLLDRPWVHQHPNGLICIHHMAYPAKSTLSKLPIASSPHVQTLGHKAPNQQIVLALAEPLVPTSQPQQQLDSPDYSSFDYVATSSSLIEPTKAKYPLKGPRESPMSPAQKLPRRQKVKLDSTSLEAQEQIPANGEAIEHERQVPRQQQQTPNQQRFIDLPFESRSTQVRPVLNTTAMASPSSSGETGNNNNTNSVTAHSILPPASSSRLSGHWQHHKKRNGSKSIIPFTIKDKIETSAGPRRAVTNKLDQLSVGGYPVVQYDEPSDVEVEQHSPAPTNSHLNDGRQPFAWPPTEERRSNTSFLASPNQRANKYSKPTFGQNIDYRKEAATSGRAASDFGAYTLPLLMASSSKMRGHRKSGTSDSFTGGRVPSSYTTKSFGVTVRPTNVVATTTELIGAASSAVSTSSTLDGQPVLLSSGPVQLRPTSEANTVELMVNSTTSEQTDAGSSRREFANNDDEEGRTQKVGESTAEVSHGPAASPNYSDQSYKTSAFDNNKLMTLGGSGGGHSMEEFDRISEALQMNPLDLIDLQNSRSNFELPSQLESLSMLFNGNHAARGGDTEAQEVQPVYGKTNSNGDKTNDNKNLVTAPQSISIHRRPTTTTSTPTNAVTIKSKSLQKVR